MFFRKILTRFCQLPWIIVPVVLLGVAMLHATGGDLLAMYFFVRMLSVMLCVAFSIGLTVKFIYYKERPEPKKFTNRRTKIDASSFPSIHTAYASVCLFAGMIIVNAFVVKWENIKAMLLGVAVSVFYVLIARSRIVLKKHFFIDTVFGTLVGLIAVVFGLLHMQAIAASFQFLFGF